MIIVGIIIGSILGELLYYFLFYEHVEPNERCIRCYYYGQIVKADYNKFCHECNNE